MVTTPLCRPSRELGSRRLFGAQCTPRETRLGRSFLPFDNCSLISLAYRAGDVPESDACMFSVFCSDAGAATSHS
ncbi:hypothetical protein EVAR_5619_1 [Eumeta japonica]|uniref:Uncharacterized protein n=1 Tax=Eumeta variegata TaxID=151549 RepID=A0A4C1T9Y9_EUMVA|nr:hypothetical protein EVAR_5619_1 [Eumeta japonica]